jgi:Mg/Co/Ni transporter MgtE
VYSVTSAPESLRDDQNERMRRYLLSMGIRTACFVLSVIAIVVLHWTVVGWILVVGAVVLPYVAVVMANATKARPVGSVSPVTPQTRKIDPPPEHK